MLTIAEAIATIEAHVRPLPAVTIPLAEALGLVLAQSAISDCDSPPFDKALMDGYAVRSADFPHGVARLAVIEEVLAGQVPMRPLNAGEATRIMTGAPIPDGADAVIPVEQSRLIPEHDPPIVELTADRVSPGKNMLARGASVRAGETVVSAGRLLRPQELGALAELGSDRVRVIPRPTVAVLATGDELVPVEQRPGPGQIRNSNETMLVAQLRRFGATPIPLGIARDTPSDLREKISRGLAHDVLLLSGGVSAGKVDLVPAVLAELGVRPLFHKIRIKPGQPLWFGVYDRANPANAPAAVAAPGDTGGNACCVFGLPGNPVSSMVCCEKFARTAVRRLMGIEPAEPVPLRARLKGEFFNPGNRPTYHPALLEWTSEGVLVEPISWIGSADLCATTRADGLAFFPEGNRVYSAGTIVNAFPW
jgi:molybdopterin molybdotransferase